MTNRQVEKLILKHVFPKLPNYAVNGRLLFVEPLRYLLRGYYFEFSGLDRNKFNVEVFVQPLYIPCSHVVFTLGRRLGTIRGGQERWWHLGEGNEEEIMLDVLAYIKDDGECFLNDLATPSDLVEKTRDYYDNAESPYPEEIVAYSAVLVGDAENAADAFERLGIILQNMDHKLEYVREMAQRANLLRSAFEAERRSALERLDRWRSETLAHVRLTKFGAKTKAPR